MNAIRQQVIDMLSKHQLCNLATITEDGKPWTRYVMIQSDAEFHLRSAVCLNSRKVKQIEKNPEVHITFGINDPRDLSKPYVQIQGVAIMSMDPQEKKAYWFNMLAGIFTGPDDPNYAIMVVDPYRVEFNKPGAMIPEIWEK